MLHQGLYVVVSLFPSIYNTLLCQISFWRVCDHPRTAPWTPLFPTPASNFLLQLSHEDSCLLEPARVCPLLVSAFKTIHRRCGATIHRFDPFDLGGDVEGTRGRRVMFVYFLHLCGQGSLGSAFSFLPAFSIMPYHARVQWHFLLSAFGWEIVIKDCTGTKYSGTTLT